ncbi:MAG: phospho-sugar mutase [Bacillota bacterium]|nr:phospho-sugar mutase [Bacillota bacterium]
MNYTEKYKRWLNWPQLDVSLKNELLSIKEDQAEIESRFFQELEFGTGGLRGIIGAGTNRINIYTVRKATQGLASYLKLAKGKQNSSDLSVAIAYDSRRMSKEFALEAGLVLASNGIKAYIFQELAATPILSFAVRELQASGGIVITASHNPPEYNGYKVYGADGGQITDETAKAILAEIAMVDNELEITRLEYEAALAAGLIEFIGADLLDKYHKMLKALSLNPQLIAAKGAAVTIVYTPLHGTGNKPVVRGLQELGFSKVFVVKEQQEPDSDFSTLKYPNPEEQKAFELAIKVGTELEADILLATDPDTDRLGVVAKNSEGEYCFITGNQLGALFLEYLLSQGLEQKKLPTKGVVIKTVVTSEIGRAIAESFGLEIIDTLTGFKYIGEKIKEFQEAGERQFVFGYEESYGYLIGDFVRDKDAIQACQMAAEMALYYKLQGMTLIEKLQDVFSKYGYYQEDLVSFTLEGKGGQQKIGQIMDNLRQSNIQQINRVPVIAVYDYFNSILYNYLEAKETTIELPQANVLKFLLADSSWFCVRPSGTEPKFKVYFGVLQPSLNEATERLARLKQETLELIKQV